VHDNKDYIEKGDDDNTADVDMKDPEDEFNNL